MEDQFEPRRVYIAASWMAPVGRYQGKEREKLSFLQMAAKATELFHDTTIRPKDIEAVVVGCQNPVAFSGVDNTAAKVAGVLGISGATSVLIDTASSSGASAFENAYLQIASGRCDHVLAIGIQKMSDVNTIEATRIVAVVIDRDEAEYGLSMPACGALVAGALVQRLGLSLESGPLFPPCSPRGPTALPPATRKPISASKSRLKSITGRLPTAETICTGGRFAFTISVPCPTV